MIQVRTKYFAADKIIYPDGVGCCIWKPWPDNEEIGIAFDFAADEIDDLIELLTELKSIPAIPLDTEE